MAIGGLAILVPVLPVLAALVSSANPIQPNKRNWIPDAPTNDAKTNRQRPQHHDQ